MSRHQSSSGSSGAPARRRRAELFETAYRAGLKHPEAEQWVREQLKLRQQTMARAERTPTLFGTHLAKQLLAEQGVRRD